MNEMGPLHVPLPVTTPPPTIPRPLKTPALATVWPFNSMVDGNESVLVIVPVPKALSLATTT